MVNINCNCTYTNSGRIQRINGEVKLINQTVDIFSYFAHTIESKFILKQPISLRDTFLVANTGHGINIGDFLCIIENNRKIQVEVNNIEDDIITITGAFDYTYSKRALCFRGSNNIAVDGSNTPIHFYVGPSNLPINTIWHITHITIDILDTTEMDDESFGGISKLTNGITITKTDNEDWKNLMIFRTNGDIKIISDQFEYSNKAKTGYYGFNAIKRFSGFENNGAVIELTSNNKDAIRITVRDNLKDINRIRIMIHGHIID